MKKINTHQIVEELIETAKVFYNKNWLLGTSGNLSHILTHKPLRFIISATGTDKGNLSQKSFVEVKLASNEKILETDTTDLKPSGEAILHAAVYQKINASCVIHVHSPISICIAKFFLQQGEYSFNGFEIQKGLGFSDKLQSCRVPIFTSVMDLKSLSQKISSKIQSNQVAFLIEKHGLFAWGESVTAAKRHVELLHHMFEYELLEQKTGKGGDYHHIL